MKSVYKIDGNGFFLEHIVLNDKDITPSDCIEAFPTSGLYKHKWNGSTWEEGATQEEITELTGHTPPLSEIELLKKQQTDLVFELMMNGVL